MTRLLSCPSTRQPSLSRPQHRTPSEPIIALIDVVFFLLVFFMLVARLDASAPFEVVPPNAVSGRDMPGGGVTISIARDGQVAVNGTAYDAEAWLVVTKQAAQRDQATLLRVNAHRATPLRFVLPITEALDAAAIGEVVLVVTP
ncbi:ExbD/TolR family protein [Shimia sagamensis]|uniref:Biopolymer transport protein ExbD n=1 Tax=Shimia sagamensis TaxID=1566352 RepID=A0ABY1PLW6_9RHOB|nr:biopolymer transporter ExbD [Shimia sagamensis]SMP34745.1 biopolymer transport protein ExbD [Shimia sagamensis]